MILHDIANAAYWSMFPFATESMLVDIWATVKSIRDSYWHIIDAIFDWLPSVLVFVPHDVDEDFYRQLWSTISVQQDVASVLVQLRLIFRDGKLSISERFRHRKDLYNILCGCLMGVWRFDVFSDSRFLQVSATGRQLIGGCLTGVHSLISFVYQHGKIKYYLKSAATKLTTGVQRYCLVACLSAGIAEELLLTLMDDDRLLLQIDAVRALMQEEWSFVTSIPASLWAIFAELVDDDVYTLRSDVIVTAMTIVCFFHWRVLAQLEQFPWSLCIGDIGANLTSLSAMEEPPEETVAQKIWCLLQFGYCRDRLIAALQKLRHIPWSTAGIEQMHAALALVMRFHPALSGSMGVQRAFAYMLQSLASKDDAAKRRDKHLAMVSRLNKRLQQRRMKGRERFLKMSMRQAKERLKNATKQQRWHVRKTIMKKHSSIWNDFDADTQHRFEQRAYEESRQQTDSVVQSLQELEEAERLRQQREQASLAARNCFNIDACRFTPGQMEQLEILDKSPE